MAELTIRKLIVQIDETHREMGKALTPPSRKAVAAAVIVNPYAGKYVEDLSPLYDVGAEIGGLLAKRAVGALRVNPGAIQSYGKGCVVGVHGELEHAAAILHPKFGKPVREAVEKGDDIIPSTKKMGGPGSVLLMPLTHKDNIWSFDHMDAAEITVPDGPGADELLVAVAVADDGRPLARVQAP